MHKLIKFLRKIPFIRWMIYQDAKIAYQYRHETEAEYCDRKCV